MERHAEDDWEELQVLGSSPPLSQFSLDDDSFEQSEALQAPVTSERTVQQEDQREPTHISSTSTAVERHARFVPPASSPIAITSITSPPTFVGEDRFFQVSSRILAALRSTYTVWRSFARIFEISRVRMFQKLT